MLIFVLFISISRVLVKTDNDPLGCTSVILFFLGVDEVVRSSPVLILFPSLKLFWIRKSPTICRQAFMGGVVLLSKL